MHVLVAVLGGVGGVHEGDEVCRHLACALVNQLVEGMLTIGARLTPEDLARVGRNGRAVPAHVLAIGLHRELLEVGGEAMQVLVVGQHGVAGHAKEVHVPDVDEAHKRHDVLLERRVLEVLVHVMEAGKELGEDLWAKGNDQREAHGGVHGVAAADPAPEAKGVLRVDAKGLDLVERGGDGHEVLLDGLGVLLGGTVDGASLTQAVEQPSLDLARVGKRLERGERLGDDDHERGLGIEALDLLGHVVGVDVGDVGAVDAGVGIGLQTLIHHDRAEVGTTDAHADHVLDGLAGNALPLAGAHAVGEGVHAVEHLVNIGHGVLAIHDELAGLLRRTAQGRVEHGAVLGGVDVGAGVHGVATLLELDRAGEGHEQLDGLVVNEVLGEVEVQVTQVEGKLLDTCGVVGKPLLEANTSGLELIVVLLERRPLRGLGGVDRCRYVRHRSSLGTVPTTRCIARRSGRIPSLAYRNDRGSGIKMVQ